MLAVLNTLPAVLPPSVKQYPAIPNYTQPYLWIFWECSQWQPQVSFQLLSISHEVHVICYLVAWLMINEMEKFKHTKSICNISYRGGDVNLLVNAMKMKFLIYVETMRSNQLKFSDKFWFLLDKKIRKWSYKSKLK